MTSSQAATLGDLREILGDLDDTTTLAILAIHPTVAQLEEARIWLDGGDDALGKTHRPLEGVTAQIFEMLKVYEDESPRGERQP